MTVRKIISGAQVGADIAGLRAAKFLDLETGGWMPAGFRTLTGPCPRYAKEYGIRCTNSPAYPRRTENNVRDSDGTVRFAQNFGSPGEICTKKAIEKYNKPFFDIYVERGAEIPAETLAYFWEWLREHDIQVLNVAGNAAGWLEPMVEEFLVQALEGA